MPFPQQSRCTYTRTVGLLGNALGIKPWDLDSRRGLRDFALSPYLRAHLTELAHAYLDRREALPSLPKIMEEALWYYNPTLDPSASESINPHNLACAIDKAGKEQSRRRRGCVPDGQVLSGAFYMALFAARLINDIERSSSNNNNNNNNNMATPHLASPELAWFPLRFHHKIAFAVALMYFQYFRIEWRPRGTFGDIRKAASEALRYMTCFRCFRCGQDYQDPKAGPLCGVCPVRDGERLDFERERARVLKLQVERQKKLEAEVDSFFDSLEDPRGFVVLREEAMPVPPPGPEDPAWPVYP